MTSTTKRARCLCGSHSSIDGGSRKLVRRSVGRKLAWGKCPEEGANRRYDSNVAPTEPPDIKSDRWGGRPQRHQCAAVRVVRTCREGAARDEHYHDRPGHRQVRLSSARRERDRKGGDQAQVAKERTAPVLREAGGLHHRHGGVRRSPSLGPDPVRSWTRRETDRARGSQTLREKRQEERPSRCSSTLHSRISA